MLSFLLSSWFFFFSKRTFFFSLLESSSVECGGVSSSFSSFYRKRRRSLKTFFSPQGLAVVYLPTLSLYPSLYLPRASLYEPLHISISLSLSLSRFVCISLFCLDTCPTRHKEVLNRPSFERPERILRFFQMLFPPSPSLLNQTLGDRRGTRALEMSTKTTFTARTRTGSCHPAVCQSLCTYTRPWQGYPPDSREGVVPGKRGGKRRLGGANDEVGQAP